jgi:hypothetical protein
VAPFFFIAFEQRFCAIAAGTFSPLTNAPRNPARRQFRRSGSD